MKPTIMEFLVILCQVSRKSSRLIQEKKKKNWIDEIKLFQTYELYHLKNICMHRK